MNSQVINPPNPNTWTQLYNSFPSLLADKKLSCRTCQEKKIGKEQLLFCENSCWVKNWIEEHGYLKNKEEVLSYFSLKDFLELRNIFGKKLKKNKNRKLDRHKDKYHQKNYYREQILKMELEMRNWKLVEKPFKESGKFKDNLLIFPLKKVVDKKLTYSSSIYKTWFFLYNTHDAQVPTIEQKGDNLNPAQLPIWTEIKFKKNNNLPFNNSLQFDKKNHPSNTLTSENEKDKQITVDYSIKNNFYLFKYLFFHYQPQLSEILLKKPRLFKTAFQYFDWLIIYYGQTKPWEFVRLLPDWLANIHKQDPIQCWLSSPCQGNPKVPHHTYKNPHYQKGDLSCWLIKCGRVFLKTDNYFTPEIDVAKNEEQQLRQPWRTEALQQFKKLADYLGLPLIPSPSGGKQIQHRRIKGKEVINGSNLYYCSKSTNYNKESCGEPRGKGQGVVHPLSKDRLPELTEEFLKRWRREQDKKPPHKRKGFRFITPEQKNGEYAKIYARFGFHFTNQLPKKEPNQPTVRDSRNDLTDTSLSILGIKQLSEQKTVNYDPWQINFIDQPFGEKKHLILNATHPYQKQLLVQFLKSNGSPFHFKLLQLSLDFHLQRWKSKEDRPKPTQPFELPIIPRRKEGERWKVKVVKSRINRELELENGTFQQVILTDENKQDYSVLFNPESKGIKEPFLHGNIGNFANTFLLKAGRNWTFLQPRTF